MSQTPSGSGLAFLGFIVAIMLLIPALQQARSSGLADNGLGDFEFTLKALDPSAPRQPAVQIASGVKVQPAGEPNRFALQVPPGWRVEPASDDGRGPRLPRR